MGTEFANTLVMDSYARTSQILIFCFLGLILTGCGSPRANNAFPSPGGDNQSNQFDRPMGATGFDKEIITQDEETGESIKSKVPYVVSGETDLWNELSQLPRTEADELLAQSIVRTQVVFKNKRVKSQAISSPTPIEVQIDLKLGEGDITYKTEFEILLNSVGGIYQGSSVQKKLQEDEVPLTLTATCKNPDCSLLLLELKKKFKQARNINSDEKNDKKEKKAEDADDEGHAYIIVRESEPELEVTKANNVEQYRAGSLNQMATQKAELAADKSSVTVVGGVSYSKIRVYQRKGANEELVLIGQIDLDSLSTDEVSPETALVQLFDKKDYIGELVGNDSETGSMMIDITAPDTKEKMRITLREKLSSSAQELPLELDPEYQGIPSAESEILLNEEEEIEIAPLKPIPLSTFIEVPASPDQPDTLRVSRLLRERYDNNNEARRMSRVWLSMEKDRLHPLKNSKGMPSGCRRDVDLNRLKNFFKYAPNVLPYIQAVTESLDVTPEIAYLLAFESNYLSNGSYDSRALGGSGDTGPWQITPVAAKAIEKNLTSFDLIWTPNTHLEVVGKRKVRRPDNNDDRIYLVNSTYMAALFLRDLFKKFPSDPAMAIVAYNGGEGGARGMLRSTSKYSDFDTTLADVFNFRIRSKSNCRAISYAFTFLGIYRIGQNLPRYEKWGVSEIAPAKSKEHKKKLIGKGQLPKDIIEKTKAIP